MLDWSVAARLLSRNQAVGAKLPRYTPKLARAASVESVHRLAELVGPSARDLVLTLAYTGMRWGEATALRVEDIDLGRRRITVCRSFVEVDGELRLGTPKSHRSRQVPIVSILAEILHQNMAGKGLDELVFGRANGSPWRNSNFRRDAKWDWATKEAGLPGFRIHDLRHTTASLMIESGASVVDVAAVLGHASSHTTLTIYAHLIGARLDDVAERLGTTIAKSRAQNVPTGGIEGPDRDPQKRGE
jgi:integrase